MERKWSIVLTTIAVLGLLSIGIAWALQGLFVGRLGSGNVAVIPIKGVITTQASGGFLQADTADSETIVSFIKEADSDRSIKAIILDIDSPGGSPVATDEIARAVRATNKTTVAVIHEVGASGAYWVASATDHIVANPMSIVGSIGVISSYLDFSGLMAKYGVHYNRIVSGDYKDIGSPYRNITAAEMDILQQKNNLLLERFISAVAENRNMSVGKVRGLATGEFWLGDEAITLGLVDQLGTEDDAVSYLEDQLGTQVSLVEYRRQESFLQSLANLMSQQSYTVGLGIGKGLVQEPLQQTGKV